MQDRGVGPALTLSRPVHRVLLVAAVAGAALAVDQVTKAWALDALEGGRTIDLVWTLQLRLVFNRSSAFGIIGSGLAPLIALVAVALVVILFRTSVATGGRLTVVAIGLVVGGALGNLADRVFRAGEGPLGGAVIDFIDLQWWPVFNVADSCIVVGSALLALGLSREPTAAAGSAR